MAFDSSAKTNLQRAVAQSAAIAVQDAVDNLRHIEGISTTTIGVAFAKFLETDDPRYPKIIKEASKVFAESTEQFAKVGKAAAEVVKSFE